jgi:dienelactone hydrolase
MRLLRFEKARPRGRAFFISAIALLMLAACTSVTDVLKERGEIAADVAAHGGLSRFFVDTGQFEIVGYRRFANAASNEVAIYIEGDGLAFLSANVISKDPTPRDPVSLRLAALDPSPNVAYLARPCQYQQPSRLARCSYAYWTSSRFAPVVIKEMNIAVDAIKKAARADHVRLYGYSGGGVVAALLAARRDDVAFLATAASPLDHRAWTQTKGFSPLRQSLNPANEATQAARVPQIHFVGSDDDLVTRPIIESYASKVLAAGGKVSIVDVAGANHTCCWSDKWPELHRRWLRQP